MQHDAAVELLARAPMFLGLGGELLTAILQRGDMRHFGVGETLATAGKPARESLFILEGEVTLLDPGGCEIELKLHPGMSLNDMAMFVETSHFYGAEAEEEVAAFSLQRDVMSHLLLEQPYLAEHFTRTIRQKLTMMAGTLRELDETLSLSTPEVPSFDDTPLTNGASIDWTGDFENGAVKDSTDVMGNALVAQDPHGIPDVMANSLPVQDLLADLNAARGRPDQIPPVRGHDQRALPSLAPRRSHEARSRTFSEPGLPTHGRADGPDLSPANSARGSSTR